MTRTMSILLDTLYALALALWFGLLAGLFVVVRPGAPDATLDLFAHRTSGIIEVAGVAMVGAQFLLRRRYGRNRQLAVADSVRQLLTYGALLLAEFAHYSLLKPDNVITVKQVTMLCQLAGAQMTVLAVVTALTSWLLLPRALVGATIMPTNAVSNNLISPPNPMKQQKLAKPTRQQRRK